MSAHICGGERSSAECPTCVAEDDYIHETAAATGRDLGTVAAEFYGWGTMTAPEFLAREYPPDPPALRKKARIPRGLARQVMERDAYRCQEPGCGTWLDLTIDHIIPESLDGPTVLSNLRTLCRSHNASKGARLER